MHNSIYPPAEDSMLLAEEVYAEAKNLLLQKKSIKVLDMGTGSGILAETALKAGCKKKNIIAADINQKSAELMKKKGFKSASSDLFSRVRGKFDLIIFNPPYLPENKHDKKIDTAGGKKGYETSLRFIRQIKSHLSEKGMALLLSSSFTSPNILKKEMKKQGLEFRKTASKRFFFEELFVWRIRNAKTGA